MATKKHLSSNLADLRRWDYQISRLSTYIVFTALALVSFTACAGGEKGLIVSIPITFPNSHEREISLPSARGDGKDISTVKRQPVPGDSHKQAPARTHQASLLKIMPGESASFLSPSDVPCALITPSTLTEITGQPPETASRQKNKTPTKRDKLKAMFARIRKPHTQPESDPFSLESCTPSVFDISPAELNSYLPGGPVPSLADFPTESGFYSGATDELQTPVSLSVIDHEETSLIPPSLYNALLPSLLPHFSAVEQQDGNLSATRHSLAKPSGFANLKLETVSADTSPFPALTPASGQTLTEFSPGMKKLAEIVRQDQNPLREQGELSHFLRSLPDETESYRVGNHSLVIKRRDAPGHVAKIARSNTRDAHSFRQELQLYQYIRKPGMEFLALNTCPLLKAFCFAGRPVLVMEQIDFIADQQLIAMKDRTLFDRLDFALTWLWRFCDVYRLFLEHGILLADRHGGNIGFNETRLPPMPELDFPGATLRIPVMLDLDPYWTDDTETTLRLSLPTWMPVAMDLLERAFHSGKIDDESRGIHNNLRKLAMPAEYTQAECQTEQWQGVENLVFQSITFWLSSQEESPLKDEAKQWLPRLFTLSGEFHDKARTVGEWVKLLQAETERIISTLSQWKACSWFGFMEDCHRTASTTAPLALNQNRQEDNASQPQTYSQAALARNHVDIKCDQCSRCFRSLDEYNSHYKNHELGKLKVCDVCDGGYANLKSHQRTHTGEKPFPCTYQGCNMRFITLQCMERHRRTHTGESPFKCEHSGCGKQFSQQSSLKNHLRTHSSEKSFECRHCGKKFSDQANLKRHLRTHTGEKPFKCERCGKEFAAKDNLKRHLRTHTGEKPFKCEHCDKGFTEQSKLKRHLHSHTITKSFPCTYKNCNKRFTILQNMKRHLRIHTGERPFPCLYQDCNRRFTTRQHLKEHLRTHTGERPFKCEHPGCGKRFAYRGDLTKHWRIHTGERPYNCEHCGQTFAQVSTRNSHLSICQKNIQPCNSFIKPGKLLNINN